MRIKLLAAWLLGAAVGASAGPDPFLIVPGRGVGPLRAGMAKRDIQKLLKPEELGEGEEAGRSILSAYFMDTHKRVTLRMDARGRVVAMVLHGDRSQWHDARGISLGTTVSTLQRLNVKPFRVHAFDGSATAGQLLDWGGGDLAQPFAQVKLTFASPMHASGYGQLSEKQKLEIEKARDFLSTDAELRLLDPVIETIELRF